MITRALYILSILILFVPAFHISLAQAGSTVVICSEAHTNTTIDVELDGYIEASSGLGCSNTISFDDLLPGWHFYVAIVVESGFDGKIGSWGDNFYVDGVSTYYLTICPDSDVDTFDCCSSGCGSGGSFRCNECGGDTSSTTTTSTLSDTTTSSIPNNNTSTTPTTTTSTISVTTSINPTTTTVGSGCLPGEIDCGNGYCCPPDYPICGYGQDTGYCFSEGGGCLSETIYGEQSAETKLLRSLRDNILSKTTEGRELIKLYYQWSPSIVKAMEEEDFKEEIKNLIDEMLLVIDKLME